MGGFQSIIILIFLQACAATYSVQSRPSGVNVYDGEKLIGPTPLEISAGDLTNENASGSLLRLEKKGYKNLWMWLPRGAYIFDINLNMNPLYLSGSKSESDIAGYDTDRLDLYRITDMLLEIQTNLFIGKEIDENVLKGLLETNPTLGSVHYLSALHRISKNQTEEASVFMKDAIRYSPSEDDFMTLFNEINVKAGKK